MNNVLRTASALSIVCAGALGGPASGAALGGTAHVARALNVREEGRLRYVSSSGSQLIDEGLSTGTLTGKVRVHLTYDGSPDVVARFTIYASGGSISGQAAGRLSNPNSATPSFRGQLTLSGGSGRYAHAHGSGELFGVFNRRTYGLTVQTVGQLRY